MPKQTNEPEFIHSSTTVDLRDVIRRYVEEYKVNGNPVLSYDWGINPITQQVVFTFISKNKNTKTENENIVSVLS
jgi:hypothetical protein